MSTALYEKCATCGDEYCYDAGIGAEGEWEHRPICAECFGGKNEEAAVRADERAKVKKWHPKCQTCANAREVDSQRDREAYGEIWCAYHCHYPETGHYCADHTALNPAPTTEAT